MLKSVNGFESTRFNTRDFRKNMTIVNFIKQNKLLFSSTDNTLSEYERNNYTRVVTNHNKLITSEEYLSRSLSRAMQSCDRLRLIRLSIQH